MLVWYNVLRYILVFLWLLLLGAGRKQSFIIRWLTLLFWENTLSYLFWIIIYDWTLWLSTKTSINTMFPERVNKSYIMWIVALFCVKTLMSRLAEKVKSAQYAICCGNFPINCTVKHICQSRYVNGKAIRLSVPVQSVIMCPLCS